MHPRRSGPTDRVPSVGQVRVRWFRWWQRCRVAQVRRQLCRGPGETSDVVGIDRFGAAAVDDDVAVDLEHPESPDQWLVHGTGGGVPLEVVQIASERDPAVACEFLRDGLLHTDHRCGRHGEVIPVVDGEVDRFHDLRSQTQRMSCEFDLRAESGTAERCVDPQVSTSPVVSQVVDREGEVVEIHPVQGVQCGQREIITGCGEVEIGGEAASVSGPEFAQCCSSFEHQAVGEEPCVVK